MILGTWWGYADGNRTMVGAVVVIILVAAVGFVAKRILERRREAGQHRSDASLRMPAQPGRSKRPSAAQSGRFSRRR